MTTITLNAPAKINLWLDIKSRRPDGYHNIESVMQTVSLFDELTLERHDTESENKAGTRNRRRITISCSVDELACDESNLCYRAAQEFFSLISRKSYNVSIHIEKHIPIAAGLAGGSTDAATTLIGLNSLYDSGLTVEQLCELGSRIGADVPFCIKRGISVTRGIGEIFSPCARMSDCYILIACEGERVSTPWAYKRLDEMYDFAERNADVSEFTQLLSQGELTKTARGISNIFESAVLPVREKARLLKNTMLECGALNALMSGSGPSVFGIFEDIATAEATKQRLNDSGIAAYICEPYYEITNKLVNGEK
ncbi:MAG: 4-(cytidine 5'-diphospho)-2-C-methyl-D-erythritol kinase [Clostridiales bacterium]|nr:4-(cytidine 5'-diphospho)-2-C-methyl-D-erythritol kinase [Clostridiales bacterium]